MAIYLTNLDKRDEDAHCDLTQVCCVVLKQHHLFMSVCGSPQGHHKENRPVRVRGIWIHQPPPAVHGGVCMKESLASPFAHLQFVQAAVSAKNHSQASPERRGGRVKDSREDELPLRTWQQANTDRREEEFPPLDNLDLFCRRTKRSFYWYAPGKQRHWTSRTFPIFLSSSSFLFHPFLLPECPSSCGDTTSFVSFVLWAESCFILCLPSWSISPRL